MCYRFYMEMSSELRPYVEAAGKSTLTQKMITQLGKPLTTEGEIFPSSMVPVIAPNKDGAETVFSMVWGFDIKGLSRPVMNARVESASWKVSFREAWKKRRCIIPASWYFEWEHIPQDNGKMKTGTKYAIQPAGTDITYLAGLYQMQEFMELKYPVFTILTREPTQYIMRIHDRMPLILPKECIGDWISPDGKPEDILPYAVTDLIAEPVRCA